MMVTARTAGSGDFVAAGATAGKSAAHAARPSLSDHGDEPVE
jgi:hypothetical protein